MPWSSFIGGITANIMEALKGLSPAQAKRYIAHLPLSQQDTARQIYAQMVPHTDVTFGHDGAYETAGHVHEAAGHVVEHHEGIVEVVHHLLDLLF
jgi:hypothetical protein